MNKPWWIRLCLCFTHCFGLILFWAIEEVWKRKKKQTITFRLDDRATRYGDESNSFLNYYRHNPHLSCPLHQFQNWKCFLAACAWNSPPTRDQQWNCTQTCFTINSQVTRDTLLKERLVASLQYTCTCRGTFTVNEFVAWLYPYYIKSALEPPNCFQYTSVQTLSIFTSKANSPFIKCHKPKTCHFIPMVCSL